MVGTHDERDVGEPGVAERRDYVVEKGATVAHRHERFVAGLGRLGLRGRQRDAGVGGAHARTESAGEHYGLANVSSDCACMRDTIRASIAPLTAKSTAQNAASSVR